MSFLDNITAHLPFAGKAEEAEYFFALNISMTEATAAVWSIFSHKLDVLGHANISYEGTADLLGNAHQSLDAALGALEIQPQKILFGVPESWSLDDNLKEPYLKLLRKMVKEYDLEPMAFVTTTHAISHFLQKQEGVPPTALLVGIGGYVECTLVKGGKIIESRNIKRSERVFEDIEHCLSQFTEVEVLPSRILLYSTKSDLDLEKMHSDFMSYPWMQRLSFVHFPKIDILGNDVTIQSVVLAGAVEIDPDVDFKHSFPAPRSAVKPLPNLKTAHSDNLDLEKSLPLEEVEEEDLGFQAGDIREARQHVRADEMADNYQADISEDLEEDAFMKPEQDLPEAETAIPTPRGLTRRPYYNEEENYPSRIPLRPGVKGSLVDSILLPLWELIPGFRMPSFGRSGLLIPAVFLTTVILGVFAAYALFFKATVTVYVEPKQIINSAQVTADPKVTQVDSAKNIIPGQVLTTTVTDTGNSSATGQKEIGDPAKGQIVIYNKTDSSHTFSQGAVLVGQNNLQFSLDSTVTVASQSAMTEGIVFGKGSGSVTASQIGPDSNLPADTTLSFKGLADSDYSAKVDQAFTGGTSQTVTVVTADDQKKLKDQVLDDLKQKARDDLQNKAKDGQKVLIDAMQIEDGTYKFSKSVGDQASEFSLNASVNFKVTAYKEDDLKSLVMKLVDTKEPDGYTLNLADTETTANVAEVKDDGRLIFNAKYTANLKPNMDTNMLKSVVKAKTKAQAIAALKRLDHVLDADITLHPNIPGPFNFLPFQDKNITVDVTTK